MFRMPINYHLCMSHAEPSLPGRLNSFRNFKSSSLCQPMPTDSCRITHVVPLRLLLHTGFKHTAQVNQT